MNKRNFILEQEEIDWGKKTRASGTWDYNKRPNAAYNVIRVPRVSRKGKGLEKLFKK